jgi:hypothetical protein
VRFEVFTGMKIQVEVSGLWHCVVLMYDTNILENLAASLFRHHSPEDLNLNVLLLTKKVIKILYIYTHFCSQKHYRKCPFFA